MQKQVHLERVSMSVQHNDIIFNPNNKGIIDFLFSDIRNKKIHFLFIENEDNFDEHEYSTHPELVDFIIRKFSTEIPEGCKAILNGVPILVNPLNGIIFAAAVGTLPLLLRLKLDDLILIEKLGARRVLSDLDGIYADARVIGPNWIFSYSFIPKLELFFLKAYNYTR